MICQLLIDPPAAGPWNMAVDETLLLAADENNVASLRLYQWAEPTLSLGYFQRYNDRQQHPPSRDCAVVRRQTGGGAILHDRELTYSIALPAAHPLARDHERLYTAVHEAFLALLEPSITETSARLTLRINDRRAASTDSRPFLCFARRAHGDLLLWQSSADQSPAASGVAWKILGSAQRRRRGAILQHGSLLLGASSAAPGLAGIFDLTAVRLEVDQIVPALSKSIGNRLCLTMHKAVLSNEMRQIARQLEKAKYGSPGWIKRR